MFSTQGEVRWPWSSCQALEQKCTMRVRASNTMLESCCKQVESRLLPVITSFVKLMSSSLLELLDKCSYQASPGTDCIIRVMSIITGSCAHENTDWTDRQFFIKGFEIYWSSVHACLCHCAEVHGKHTPKAWACLCYKTWRTVNSHGHVDNSGEQHIPNWCACE